jgi:hypothetical protein
VSKGTLAIFLVHTSALTLITSALHALDDGTLKSNIFIAPNDPLK